MKPRHAAAIALVGWYLMAPPVRQSRREPAYVDEHAGYRDWKILHDFKTADECEAGRVRGPSSLRGKRFFKSRGRIRKIGDLWSEIWGPSAEILRVTDSTY